MKVIMYILFLIYSLSIYAFSGISDLPVSSTGNLLFHLDHTQFDINSEGKIYTEFYVMIYTDQLKSKEKNGYKEAVISSHVELNSIDTGEIRNKKWDTSAKLTNKNENNKSQVIYDQWADYLLPGDYELTVHIADTIGDNNGESKLTFNISSPDLKQMYASQIEFVSNVLNSTSQKHFVKANRTIYPNPSRRYGILNPDLWVYFELHNLEAPANGKLNITFNIRNRYNELVKAFKHKEIKKPGKSAVIIQKLDVSDIPSGIYKLHADAKDSYSEKTIELSRSFEIIQMDYLSSIAVLDSQQAQIAENQIKYIATPLELDLFKQMDLSAKAEFLVRFWKSKDPITETTENEFLINIQQRYNYANDNFGWGKTEGWKSDRGRILIKYGKPDLIERHNLEAETLPYDVWEYQEEKRFIFVFVDQRSNGNYMLVHSTREDEVQNKNWRDLTKKLY